MAYSNDAMVPAREVYNFAKDHKGIMTILGGIFEGAFKDQNQMTELATVPDMDTLRGMFANVINSPLQRLAVVLNQVAEEKES